MIGRRRPWSLLVGACWLVLLPVMVAGSLNPAMGLVARADVSGLPAYPPICPAGSWVGAEIDNGNYGAWHFDGGTPFDCAFPSGSYSESVQSVKPGQEITFHNASGSWDAQTNNPSVSEGTSWKYLQLQRAVGTNGVQGGNIASAYGSGCINQCAYTDWAKIVSGCTAGSTTCTIQIQQDATAAAATDLWYTVGGIDSNSACATSGGYCELAFYLETGLPTAAFSYQQNGKPGSYEFSDASSPGYGNILTSWAWDFGDGTTSAVPDPAHAFSLPGTYSVSLTVSDSGGHSDTTTQSVTVNAPTLGVSISFPGAGSNGVPTPNPGDTFPAVLTVSASDGLGNLSNLLFSGIPLNVSPSARVGVVSGPAPAVSQPFSLTPNSQVSFTYQLRANTLGLVTLNSQVSGLDAAGATVAAQANQPFTIGPKVLQVQVTPQQDKLQLTNDENGAEIPKNVSVDVTVTNASKKTLNQVQLTKVEGVRGDTVDAQIPVILNGQPSPSANVGTLAPGQSAKVTYPFQAQADGTGMIDALASAQNPDSPKETVSGFGSGTVKVAPGTVLALLMNTKDHIGPVKAGHSYVFTGTVKNLTNSESLLLDPLKPTITGNVGDGYPVDLSNPDNATPNAFPYPFGGKLDQNPCVMAPPACPPPSSTSGRSTTPASGALHRYDSTVDYEKPLSVTITPAPDGPTRGTLTYAPTGVVQAVDGTLSSIEPKSTLLQPSGGTITVSVDTSVPPFEPTSLNTKVGIYTSAFFDGLQSWTGNMLQGVAALPQTAEFLASAPIGLLQALGFYVYTLQYMSPQQRSQYYEKVAVQMANQEDAVASAVYDSLAKWAQQLGTAWGSGDSATVYNMVGQLSGNVAPEALMWYLTKPAEAAQGAKSVAEETVSLQEAQQQSTIAKRIAKDFKDLEAADDLLAINKESGLTYLAEYYGVSNEEADVALQVAKDMNVQIAFRRRNPLSTDLVGLVKAVVKPENFKLKTVNKLDELLGYRKVDEGLLILKQPISKAELFKNLRGQPEEVIQAAYQRWQSRVSEWDKYAGQYQKWSEDGWISIGKDREINGISSPTKAGARKFKLQKLKSADGTEMWEMQMGDASGHAGTLRPITGDIDTVAITKLDGTALSGAERLKIYNALENSPFDMQHGDTINWLLHDSDRNDLLSAHYPGGEPLAVVTPNGIHAGYINPNLTTFGKSTGTPRIWIDGAMVTPRAAPLGSAPTSVAGGVW